MAFIRELLGNIVETLIDITTDYYESGKAHKAYNDSNIQINSLNGNQSSEEQRQKLAEMQAKRKKLGEAINAYDTRFRDNPEAFDKLDNCIDKIKGR